MSRNKKIIIGAIVALLVIAGAAALYVSRKIPDIPQGRGIEGIITEDWSRAFHGLVLRDDENANQYTPFSTVAHKDIYWNRINPAQGVFDWDGNAGTIDGIDDYLDALVAQCYTRWDGEQVCPRPVWFTIYAFWTQGINGNCVNTVPGWVRALTTERIVNGQAIPALEDADFRTAYADAITALGAHIDSLPEVRRRMIAGFFVAGGYNNENQMTANYCGVTSPAGYTVQSDLDAYRVSYKAFLWAALNAAHVAFDGDPVAPSKPVFTLAAAFDFASLRCSLMSELLLSYTPRNVGFGFNGMSSDVPAFYTDPSPPQNSDAGCGPFDIMAGYMDEIPVKWEPSLETGRFQQDYWAWLLSLAFHVDLWDVQQGWICSDAYAGCTIDRFDRVRSEYGFPKQFTKWLWQQAGQAPPNADQLWFAFHTTEFPSYGIGRDGSPSPNGYAHGYEGNLNHFMKVKDGESYTVLCNVPGMPTCQNTITTDTLTNPYSRFAGQMTSTGLTIQISDTLGIYGQTVTDAAIYVAYLGNSTDDFTVSYMTGPSVQTTFTVPRGSHNDGAWHWHTQFINSLYLANELPVYGGGRRVKLLEGSGTPPLFHVVG